MELLLKSNDVLVTGFFERVVSLWPFLIVLVLLLLAFLWYNQVRIMRKKHQRQVHHDRRRPIGVINPIILLGIITLLILMLLALPFFFERLEEAINEKEDHEITVDPENMQSKSFQIEDINSCESEKHLEKMLNAHNGVKITEASHLDNNITIIFDTTLIDKLQIINIIEASGFVVKDTEH